MGEVADLGVARLKKLEEQQVPAGAQGCTILCCSTCEGETFCLEETGIVFCARCKIRIGPIRWFDKTVEFPRL